MSSPAPTTSQEAILEATIEEFILHGYEGVRIERVARRAGYNKALIYRWFTDKETLIGEALARRFSRRAALLDRLPTSLAEILTWWAQESVTDPDFMRMILREALDGQFTTPVHAAFRRAYYERQVALVQRLQAEGQIAQAFDTEVLFLALLAVVTLTTAVPQVVTLVTGHHPADPVFQARWQAFLPIFAASLSTLRDDRAVAPDQVEDEVVPHRS